MRRPTAGRTPANCATSDRCTRAPVRRERPCLQQIREGLCAQQLVAKATVEALAVTVLPRRARLEVQGVDLRRPQELPQLRRDELRAVVAAHQPKHTQRQPRDRIASAEDRAPAGPTSTGDLFMNWSRMALPRELVRQRQPTKRSATVAAVLHEVPVPHVVRTRFTAAIGPVRRVAKTPLSAQGSRHAKALPAAQAVHPLVVHTPSVQTKAAAHHPLAVPRMSPHALPDPPGAFRCKRRLIVRDASQLTR